MNPEFRSAFWSLVEILGKRDCWEWQGGKNGDGYGYFKRMRVNRVAYRLANGHYPRRLACHSCNNRLCCNPSHLYDGTHRQNMADMRAAGRHDGKNRRGQKHPNSKLTNAQTAAIRRSKRPGVFLANKYRVSAATISMIRHRKRRAV